MASLLSGDSMNEVNIIRTPTLRWTSHTETYIRDVQRFLVENWDVKFTALVVAINLEIHHSLAIEALNILSGEGVIYQGEAEGNIWVYWYGKI